MLDPIIAPKPTKQNNGKGITANNTQNSKSIPWRNVEDTLITTIPGATCIAGEHSTLHEKWFWS